MLYEVITNKENEIALKSLFEEKKVYKVLTANTGETLFDGTNATDRNTVFADGSGVITSYSIHYTKLYEKSALYVRP